MRHIHSIHAQNASDDCNHGETSDKLKLRELQQDKWAVHFKNVKDMKERVETKETSLIITMLNLRLAYRSERKSCYKGHY